MSKFKDFGSGSSNDNKEPISFKIHDEEFNCMPEVQGKVLLNIVADAGDEDPTKAASAINSFFNFVLDDESSVRFEALTTDKHRVVTVETLTEIISWLMEIYTNSPEAQPEV